MHVKVKSTLLLSQEIYIKGLLKISSIKSQCIKKKVLRDREIKLANFSRNRVIDWNFIKIQIIFSKKKRT